MGFYHYAIKKLDFRRKPRNYMSELKRYYGNELNNYLENKISSGNIKSFDLTDAERYAIRKKILAEVRKDNQKRALAIIVAIAIVFLIMVGMKYLIGI